MNYCKLIIIFIFISFKSTSQNYEVVYSLKKVKKPPVNYENPNSVKFYNKFIKFLEKNSKEFDIKVICSNNKYYIVNHDQLFIKSNNPHFYSALYGLIGLKQNLYFDKNYVYQYNFTNKNITKTKHSIVNYNIENKIINVKGYDCLKAKPNNLTEYNLGSKISNLRIWFSPDINIKGGPTQFGNLPGLIIALENQFVRLEIDYIKEINTNFMDLDEFMDDKEVITFENAQEYYKDFRDNIEKDFSNN